MSPQLTIGVLSRAEVLRQVMGVESAFDRGLIARFLISVPPDLLGSVPAPTSPS